MADGEVYVFEDEGDTVWYLTDDQYVFWYNGRLFVADEEVAGLIITWEKNKALLGEDN